MIIVDNNPDTPPANISAIDPTITIQNAAISMADGAALKSALRFRSRTNSGVFVTLGQSLTFAPAPMN